MKPLLKLFVAFCLVNFALSRPFPEGDEEAADGGEEPKEETTEENDGGEKPDDAAGDDAGGEDAGDEDAGGDDAGDEDAGGEDAGGEDAGGDDAGGDDAGGDDAGGDDAGEGKENGEGEEEGGDDAGGDEESSPKSGGGKGEAKDDRINTYNKVVDQMEKVTKVDHIESEYLRLALDNDLQAGLRNPVIDAIGTVGDYSKISSCFKSMGSEVKKILSQEIKSFKACKSKKDGSEYKCSEESSNKAREKFTQIGSKIVSCVSSKRN
ncbi:30 kDa salivary gland allergen Aed a 3-like isoform X2 [Ochlerotatus camptorhynchus]|uniref:30 kDa salivary gland allergen Aed a 3-like isoform X2 n=1 Tax=Ochlerotatus camptorhynchus TaxID=644619 RepID=UPI0031E2D2D1